MGRLDTATVEDQRFVSAAPDTRARARGQDHSTPDGTSLTSGPGRIFPALPSHPAADEESLDVWGFRDTAFTFNSNGNVVLSGGRYDLCGQELPNLMPWIRGKTDTDLGPHNCNPPSYPPTIPAPKETPGFRNHLRTFLADDAICDTPVIRLRHGHGHTQEEMYDIKYGRLPRVPDLVVYPSEEEQVSVLVEAAVRYDVCLIPFGGGTNVTQALRCPTNEERTIVSVDLGRLNRIEWIDPTDRMARIQAGAVGRHIMEQLASYGFTMGHEPDSVEFSTLGGWIATHASGMKKNRYGNIEDLVLDINVATSHGTLSRSSVAPRESVGFDPRRWILGSEGNLGIITSAVVKLFPLPEVQRFGSIVFPSFEQGMAFMYDLTQTANPPASVRLVDNLQFQLSMALKPQPHGWRAKKSRFEKWYVTRVRGFDPDCMVACTLVFEGRRQEVTAQEAMTYRIATRHGGMKGGSENGKRGYQLTFGIAYIRDFVMNYYILAESFETSVPWSQTLALCRNVKRRIQEEYTKRSLPGNPFISCRVTQVYPTGVCVYFYFAYYYKGVTNPTVVYSELEWAARDEILRSGGSLSHHHGIGKLRQHFLPNIMSPATLVWNQEAKRAVDPRNVFGCANQLVAHNGDLGSTDR